MRVGLAPTVKDESLQEVSTMIDVVCFCGRLYSFAGDEGACPQCGERTTVPGTSAADAQEIGEQPRKLLTQSAEDSPPKDMAA
jgi:hypothetical protein